MLLCFTLAACENSGSLDFKSVKDTKTGKVYSLGDDKSKFDDDLGTPYKDDWGYYIYLGMLNITFEDEKAIEICMEYDALRFEFRDLNFDMTHEDFADIDIFTKSNIDKSSEFYYRYYDADGNDVAEDQAVYAASVFYAPEGSPAKLSGGIAILSIMTYEYCSR